MKITLRWLKKNNACAEGIKWYKSQKETDPIKLIQAGIKSGDKTVLEFCSWGILKALPKTACIKYAIYAAEIVLPAFEEFFPGDKRPANAIKAAKNFIKTPTKENKTNAANAAHAAHAAANAANAAAYATYAANAANAANAAAYATYAANAANAANAAYDAADAATYAANAAPIDQFIKILKYGMKLLKEANK